MRRNISIHDGLWELASQAAMDLGAKQGERISTSKWIRLAIIDRLVKDEMVEVPTERSEP